MPCLKLTADSDLNLYEATLTDIPSLVEPGGGANVWYIDTSPDSASLCTVPSVWTSSSGSTWRNPSKTKWSRMVGVMTESQPVVTKDNGTLAAEFPKH
ncbi:hypothetical protein N7536_002264 [Penicillium majusculum]|nr:hypothetical protein N7536_002264 [Penicillium majusculum]